MNLTQFLAIPIALSALVEIVCEHKRLRPCVYVFKPLTMLLIILLACTTVPAHEDVYKYLVIAALIFSLAGDVFLMLPEDRFVPGLASFLLAHLAYILAFATVIQELTAFWYLLLLLLFAGTIFYQLRTGIDRLKLPVGIYMVVISVMAWLAFSHWQQASGQASFAAALGAGLFVVSDAILAIDRFGGRLRGARVAIMTTYFSAQWLLALSV